MTTITVTLSDSLRQFVEERAARDGHASPEDFIPALLSAERERVTRKNLEDMLLAGLQSESAPMTREDWDNIRREGLRRLQ